MTQKVEPSERSATMGRGNALNGTLLDVRRNAAPREGDQREHENPASVTDDRLWESIGTALTALANRHNRHIELGAYLSVTKGFANGGPWNSYDSMTYSGGYIKLGSC